MATRKVAAEAPVETNGALPRILTVSEILDAPDLPEEVVEVPEWGGAVRVRALSLEEANDAREAATRDGKQDALQAPLEMLLRGIVEPKFSEEHLVLLRRKSAVALNRLAETIARLSGVTAEEMAKAKATFRERAGSEV